MRISDLFSMGQRYLTLGLVVVAVVAVAYFLINKIILKGKKKTDFKKFIWCAASICYMVVVLGVTLMDRSGFWQNGEIMPLFYSYKDAWVDFSIISWRNIILNICMFVPFGILLPAGIKYFRSFWKTSLAGFLFTIVIEMSQLLLNLGIFELDDLLNNTVGTMIGYGLYILAVYVVKCIGKNRTENKSFISVFALQLPLIITVTVFAVIFISYEKQELGNVEGQCIVKYDADKLKVSAISDYSAEKRVLPVYISPIYSKEETVQFAQQFFELLGAELDESSNDFYEDTAVFRATDRYSFWMDYSGGTYELTDFETTFSEEVIHAVTDADEMEIREALKKYSIDIPKEAEFEILDSGEYKFTINQLIQDHTMTNGHLICEYYDNGCFSTIKNSIITCEFYKEFEAISEQEAYERIQSGEFRYYGSGELNVEVGECSIEYVIDSKGYYQPVYVFACDINNESSAIRISAIAPLS